MKQLELAEVISDVIKSKIGDEWKHEVSISSWNSEKIFAEIDDKRYVVEIKEEDYTK